MFLPNAAIEIYSYEKATKSWNMSSIELSRVDRIPPSKTNNQKSKT